MEKATYFQLLNDLFDALSEEIVKFTRQEKPPAFFIVQPPAKPAGGRWPCLQAHLDICETRQDCVFTLAGWALPQHDRTHFSSRSVVAAGEICVEVFLAAAQGHDLSAPRISQVRRIGTTIEADVTCDTRSSLIPDLTHHVTGFVKGPWRQGGFNSIGATSTLSVLMGTGLR